MIFLTLFYTFLKIGIFTFGGGYAMVSLIHNEVVVENQWLTAEEFTDILAISQMTPGPIGINTATYAGYTAVLNAGYSMPMAILGAFIASFAVILLPLTLMLIVTRFLMKHSQNKNVENIFNVLRIAVVGLIAASVLSLSTAENFGSPTKTPFQFYTSIVVFIATFIASFKFKLSPILLIVIAGVLGFVLYSV